VTGSSAWSRAVVGAVVLAITLALISFATFAPEGERAAPSTPTTTLPPPPHLVALGDSIAAGFAVGGAPYAYATTVATRVDHTVENLAVAGATAGDVLDDQLPAIEAEPDLVTITVGANDIQFGECFAALFGLGDDPCAGEESERNLDDLERDLAAVLADLHDRYPGARVFVSRYYDPLPARPADLCGFERAQFSGGGIVDRTVRRTAQRVLERRLTEWERDVYVRTTQGLARLNAAIERVGRAGDATVVPVDFTGHDMCARAAWVFAPDVDARLNFRWAGPDYAEDVHYRGRDRCTPACGPVVRFETEVDATVGTLVVRGVVRPNGTPHPNRAGQRALAAAFLAAIR
jgi:hypothetical protein